MSKTKTHIDSQVLLNVLAVLNCENETVEANITESKIESDCKDAYRRGWACGMIKSALAIAGVERCWD